MPTVSRIESQGSVKFPCQYVARPRLSHGFSSLYISSPGAFNVKSTLKADDNKSATHHVEASHDTKLVINSLNLAPADVDFLTGERCLQLNNNVQDPTVYIEFGQQFVTPPKVAVFFNLLCIDRPPNIGSWQSGETRHMNIGSRQPHRVCRISAIASQVNEKGFHLTIESSAETIFGSAQACWVAYPADREHIFSTSVDLILTQTHTSGNLRYNKNIAFGSDVAFWKIPSVFVALHMLEFKWGTHLSVNAFVDKVTMDSLMCRVETVETDSTSDNHLRAVGVTLIAVN